jgi:oxygen-independent coproporphyrinogen-3 oxidase
MASLLAADTVSSGPLNADLGVYVHLPFCHAKCHYCDFATVIGGENRVEAYLSALAREAETRGGGKISTLFIGGGTPTTLTPAQIDFFFSSLRRSFDFSSLSEATVEANPESATDDVLRAYQANGINRISFGLQTANSTLLKALGRLHSYEDFLNAYEKSGVTLGFFTIFLNDDLKLEFAEMSNILRELEF